MISKKNIYNLEKTKNFLKEFPLILIYQHNNLTVKQRINLKIQFQSYKNIKTLLVKNSIIDEIFSFYEINSYLYEKKEHDIKSTTYSLKNKDIQTLSVNHAKNNKLSNSMKSRQDLNNFLQKNKINPYLFDKVKKNNQLQNLVQGPVFLVGCHNLEDVKNIWNLLKAKSSFLFLGSQFNNKIYTHLDIQKSIELNNNIYYDFLNIFLEHLNFQNIFVYNKLLYLLDNHSISDK